MSRGGPLPREAILDGRAAGKSVTRIAVDLGITRQIVAAVLRRGRLAGDQRAATPSPLQQALRHAAARWPEGAAQPPRRPKVPTYGPPAPVRPKQTPADASLRRELRRLGVELPRAHAMMRNPDEAV